MKCFVPPKKSEHYVGGTGGTYNSSGTSFDLQQDDADAGRQREVSVDHAEVQRLVPREEGSAT